MIVVNPVINSWCAYARWLMDSSRACALGSRIVRLRTKASLSTFLTVIAKIKRSCDCAQWLIVHIACAVVVKDNAQSKNEAHAPAHEGLDADICCCRCICVVADTVTCREIYKQ